VRARRRPRGRATASRGAPASSQSPRPAPGPGHPVCACRVIAPPAAGIERSHSRCMSCGQRHGYARRQQWLSVPLCQAAGVASASAGPGSDLSEELAVGVGPVALDCRVAPRCPPGPVACRRSRSSSRARKTTSDRQRVALASSRGRRIHDVAITRPGKITIQAVSAPGVRSCCAPSSTAEPVHRRRHAGAERIEPPLARLDSQSAALEEPERIAFQQPSRTRASIHRPPPVQLNVLTGRCATSRAVEDGSARCRLRTSCVQMIKDLIAVSGDQAPDLRFSSSGGRI
jgi:hypothetical protein